MSNRAYGEFGLPAAPRSTMHWVVAGAALACVLVLLVLSWTTQSTAARLQYQAALGEPVFVRKGGGLYAPWAILRWRDSLGSDVAAVGLKTQIDARLRFGLLAGCLAGLYLAVWGLKRKQNRIDEALGSAKRADTRDVENAQLFAKDGVIIGGYVDPTTNTLRWLRNNAYQHTMGLGPTGSGKGIALVIPNCLTWRHSLIVHDPKGENFTKTSGYRATLGPVYRIDVAEDPALTAGHNPLDTVRFGTLYEGADAQRLAREIVDEDGEQFRGKSKHWAEGGASLIGGAIVHLLYKHRVRKLPTPCLYDILIELTNPENIGAWTSYAHDPALVHEWYDREDDNYTPTHPFAKNAAEEFLNRKGEEQASILSAAVTPLSLYRDPVIRANTSYSSFTADDLMDGDRPVTVYLVPRPVDKARSRPLTRIFLGAMIGRLTPPMQEDSATTTQHKHRLLLLMDEFPMLGRMEIFPDALAWMRGWGITAYILAQDYAQIAQVWGKDETLSGNIEYTTALRPNNLQTAKLLSERAGKMTEMLVQPPQKLGGRPSYGQLSRDLLTPDEIMRLARAKKTMRGDEERVERGGDMLIFGADRMIFGRQPLYFLDAELLARSKMPRAPRFPKDSRRPPPPARPAQRDAHLDEALASLASRPAPELEDADEHSFYSEEEEEEHDSFDADVDYDEPPEDLMGDASILDPPSHGRRF